MKSAGGRRLRGDGVAVYGRAELAAIPAASMRSPPCGNRADLAGHYRRNELTSERVLAALRRKLGRYDE